MVEIFVASNSFLFFDSGSFEERLEMFLEGGDGERWRRWRRVNLIELNWLNFIR